MKKGLKRMSMRKDIRLNNNTGHEKEIKEHSFFKKRHRYKQANGEIEIIVPASPRLFKWDNG